MKVKKAAEKIKEAEMLAGKLEREIGEAQEMSLYDGESMLPYRYACETVINAAEDAERLTGQLRELVAEMVPDTGLTAKYQRDIISIHGISIQYKQKIVTVRLPMLMPHRKSKYAEYLDKPLIIALQNWCGAQREKGLFVPKYKRAALCFIHQYGRGAMVRDHDNVEAKHVQDVLAMFFLQSDDGLHLDLYHTSEEAEESCTCLYLMEREDFPGWLVQRDW